MKALSKESAPQKGDSTIKCQCTCQGECQCGKYKTIRPTYRDIDINQFINTLNDWD
jgi:hypothetical protein